MTSERDILLSDPTAQVAFHRPDNRFIPIRAADLIEALAEDFADSPEDAASLRAFAEAIQRVVAQEACAFERELTDHYAPFNPDRETIPLTKQDHTPETYARLDAQLDYLLDKANFERLTEQQIHAAIRVANTSGLRVRVHPERVERFSIYVRGQTTACRRCRSWRHPIRGLERELPMFRRMAVVTQLRDDPNVILKLFKDIPAADMEALLPHVEVVMNWIDRIKVAGGGAGAIGTTASKAFGLLKGIVIWSRFLWIIGIGAALLIYRTFMGYRQTRALRDSQRTRHLYYQNLDNNAGVIHALISMNAQEETKEAVLAYAVCQNHAGKIHTRDDLNRHVIDYLQTRFDIRVDFDITDALETLTRLNLWQDRTRWEVIPPDRAAKQLETHWCRRSSADYHLNMARQRRAEPSTETTATTPS